MLNLSSQADYAIRSMIDMAMNPGLQSTLPAIADRQGIPRKFLPTIFQSLNHAGLIKLVTETGGVELGMVPAEITLRRIIEVVDGPHELYFCEIHDNDCAARVACRLRDVLSNANDMLLQSIEKITLGDLIPNDCMLPTTTENE